MGVEHRSVVRLVRNTDYVSLGPTDRIAQVSNTSFDAMTFEMWGALLNGAALVSVPKDVAIRPERMVAELRDKKISVPFVTTTLFNHLLDHDTKAYAALRYLLFGGEAVDPRWVRAALEHPAGGSRGARRLLVPDRLHLETLRGARRVRS